MAKPDPTDKLIDDLIAGKKPEEILGEDDVLKELTKQLVERPHEGEMTRQLGAFPNAESARKAVYLALQRISKKWRWAALDWIAALNHFTMVFEENAGVERDGAVTQES